MGFGAPGVEGSSEDIVPRAALPVMPDPPTDHPSDDMATTNNADSRVHAVTVRKRWSRFAVAVGIFALVVAALAALSGLGSRWGLWHFRTGFTLLQWAAYGGMAAAVLGLIAAYWTRPGTGRRGMAIALGALLLGLLAFGVPWQNRRVAAGVPAIHDITTDTENPPQFVAIAPIRADAPNPITYEGEDVARLQRSAYPDIRPVILDLPREQAFRRAYEAVERQGWSIVEADEAAGRIEATDRTFWFGFRDDVVIRLTPMDSRTVVDVRSKSRVGRSDLGANARRIRRYLEALTG
jgi:uncharacterized protein (DUF1499 family)